ncbi:OadG family protein [Pelosinus fermentans]|uniref:Sodium pump decarboxylase gamma subunit n=1 Tax=Pelosinus fermentans B4 TaxID=1149862 RepID=I9B6W1_9FIRM|nr:OadG family protein [Pelosinus fermentans]EIW20852.1 sodium pump decarboxylase gamma subunit [Pelosinus fermentans B4]
MGQPITTNPILIALINMTVVFAVLYGLSLVVRLIQVIDPTQKKRGKKQNLTP